MSTSSKQSFVEFEIMLGKGKVELKPVDALGLISYPLAELI